MSMYNRFANELSEELFCSVHDDLYKLAVDEQRAIYASCKKRKNGSAIGYYVGEAQAKLKEFCGSKLSLGDARDFISLRNALETPLVKT